MKNNTNHTKESLAEKINKSLDISPEALPGGTLISICGRQSVSIDGKVRIAHYSPNEIIVLLGKDTLRIEGQRLVCSSYHARNLSIEGRISTVSFEE